MERILYARSAMWCSLQGAVSSICKASDQAEMRQHCSVSLSTWVGLRLGFRLHMGACRPVQDSLSMMSVCIAIQQSLHLSGTGCVCDVPWLVY